MHNVGGELITGGLELLAGRGYFRCDTLLRSTDLFSATSPRLTELRLTFVELHAPRGVLLRIDLRASFFQGFFVGPDAFLGRRLGGFGGALRPGGAFLALAHHPQERLEKLGAEEEVKGEDSEDGRHSLQEKLAELSNDFHLIVAPGPGTAAALPREIGLPGHSKPEVCLNKTESYSI